VGGSPFATGQYPESVAFSSEGTMLATANSGGTLSVFAVRASGALAPVTGSPYTVGTEPYGVAFSSSGLLADANLGGSSVSLFAPTPVAATVAPVVAPTPTTTVVKPTNAFEIDGETHSKSGTIELTLTVPGPGSVAVLGTHSEPSSNASAAATLLSPGYHRVAWTARGQVTATKASTMRITLTPNSAGALMLRSARDHGKAMHVRVWATYTPTGGYSHSIPTSIRVLVAKGH